jgi:hypothetical protein
MRPPGGQQLRLESVLQIRPEILFPFTSILLSK